MPTLQAPIASPLLAALGLRHPQPGRLAHLLSLAGLEGGVAAASGAPGLWADIATPAGLRRLGSTS